MIKQLTSDTPTEYRLFYNKIVSDLNFLLPNAKVLDVGIGHYWDYSELWKNYISIDINGKAKINGNILNSGLESNLFDIVLCNGMYEYIDNIQLMVNEIHRMLKIGGIAIFGFVGIGYKYTGTNGNKYQGEDYFSNLFHVQTYNFTNEYHIFICRKK
jgi:SAM-dependent methyltransferase